jgi:hypothetical protein
MHVQNIDGFICIIFFYIYIMYSGLFEGKCRVFKCQFELCHFQFKILNYIFFLDFFASQIKVLVTQSQEHPPHPVLSKTTATRQSTWDKNDAS